MDELNKHKEREIICYCQTGSRSVSAAIILQKNGFNIANLRGGILGWNSAGLR
jgi:rhodanese-related sulfurtransferase